MFDGLVPDLAPRLMVAIGGVAVAFLVLIAVLVFLRRRNSPLFVKGGRSREHRLLVMDAAAVDAKRRLVLIRRDDVEHLIMIGGPSDIVIETGIGERQKIAAEVESAVVVARPAVPEKAAVARPAEIANRSAQSNAGRRPERQVERAAEPARIEPPQVAAVSAMGAMLYDDDLEPLTSAKPTPQAVTADRGSARSAVVEQRSDPIAAQAESVLDQARGRVLSAPAGRDKPVSTEDAIRALEEQLDAGKSEAARAAEAAKAEAAKVEAARLEAERLAAVKADAERAEAVRAEAARLEAVRLEAQKAEASRLEAERAEKARQEAERVEKARQEAARLEAEKAEAARSEAARVEAERVSAARAEAMARFEAARRAQAEQRQVAQPQPAQQESVAGRAYAQQQWPVAESTAAETAIADQTIEHEEDNVPLDDAGNGSQQRLASDFEKLLEAELEADGVLDHYPAPTLTGERREPSGAAPVVNPVQSDAAPITGAVPGVSIEHDMARRLGEITLNKKTDAL